MKKIIFLTLLSFLQLLVNAQVEKKFDYKKTQFGGYEVTFTNDQAKGMSGKLGQAWADQQYINELLYDVIKGVLPKEKIVNLHLSSSVIISFDRNGQIINCKFNINNEDINQICEEELYKMYRKFMDIKLDMSKVRIHSGNYSSKADEIFDYSIITGSLIPIEYRKK